MTEKVWQGCRKKRLIPKSGISFPRRFVPPPFCEVLKNKNRQLADKPVDDFPPLPGKDSNPHRRNQNPKCYHYTTGQFSIAKVQIYLICCMLCEGFFLSINFC